MHLALRLSTNTTEVALPRPRVETNFGARDATTARALGQGLRDDAWTAFCALGGRRWCATPRVRRLLSSSAAGRELLFSTDPEAREAP